MLPEISLPFGTTAVSAVKCFDIYPLHKGVVEVNQYFLEALWESEITASSFNIPLNNIAMVTRLELFPHL